MSLWLRPEFETLYLTGSIVLRYNKQQIALVEYNSRAMITNIFVAPDYRRRGLATHLISLVERRTGLAVIPMPPVTELGQLLFR